MARRIWAAALLLLVIMTVPVSADDAPVVRVKDIARIHGVRDNQIYGLGLVIGLQGTGDGSGARANVQMIANMLEGFGITVSADDLRLRNIAAVMVTADISSSVRNGDRIDVTVSSIGDARSLQGGFLLQTPLQAANGQIYAVAQGPLSIGGLVGRGGSGQSHTTVATIPNGAIVEQEIGSILSSNNIVSIVLHQPDFTTAARLADVVNQVYGSQAARALDQATIEVNVPMTYRNNIVSFIAQIEELPIQPDTNARVVINERTGTVVMGSSVRIAPVAVSHGGIRIQIQTPVMELEGDGFPAVTEEIIHQTAVLDGGTNVQNLVDALNAIGVSPTDIIAILQAVKASGALFGELIII